MTSADLWRLLLRETRTAFRVRLASMVDMGAPPSFVSFVSELLARTPPRRPFPAAVALIVDQGILLLAIARPGRVAFDDAVQLGLAALRLEPLFDVRVLHTLTDPDRERSPEREEKIWVLDLVEWLLRPESRALIALLPFMKDPDAVVRSKAVRLIARLQKNEAWFLEAIHDPDPRVRANLLEAVAGESNRHPAYVWKLLEMAAADSHYRPAVTAAFFMARAGDESARERLRSLSEQGRETDPARNAAAMALARLGTAIAPAANPDSESASPDSEPEPTSLPGQ